MAAALITGAARRLGREMALYLARRGYDIAVHYHGSQEAAEATAQDIRALGVRAEVFQADLTDEAQIETLLPRVIAALGEVSVLVNNASVFEYDTLGGATRAGWDRHHESNLRAPFVLSQAMAAQGLRAVADARGEPVAAGVIVNMVDQRLRNLTPEFMTYTLAKTALGTLTKTAAQALAPHIRVNAIGPGPTLQGARQSDAHYAAQRASTLLERGANPDDITATLGYFLDAKAVTGQLICVDGGQHLVWQTRDVQGVE